MGDGQDGVVAGVGGAAGVAAGPAAVVHGQAVDLPAVWLQLQAWAQALGFSQIGVADVCLQDAEPGLLAWLDAGFHGNMAYMAAHGLKRARPAELVPGTVRVITARMDYLPAIGLMLGPTISPTTDPANAAAAGPANHPAATPDWQARAWSRMADPQQAVVSLYAHGRDYHKVLRNRLQTLAESLQQAVGRPPQANQASQASQAGPASPPDYRVFTDSAPVLEVELASRSGLGWRGKHTLTLSREAGSMFFLGEIYTNLPLPVTPASAALCGTCCACISACPTAAIVAPYRLDARRCISYLTIEQDGAIPLEFRAAIGNRIYGCDDCQLACPWNKFAQRSPLPDFDVRPAVGQATLLQLWAWDAPSFLRHTEGSAIRRIGYGRWRRNLAVALGNAWRETGDAALAHALQHALPAADALVAEHITWALAQRPLAGDSSPQA